MTWPSDAKYKVVLDNAVVSNNLGIAKWLAAIRTGRYFTIPCTDNETLFVFEFEEDAVAFKLKFY